MFHHHTSPGEPPTPPTHSSRVGSSSQDQDIVVPRFECPEAQEVRGLVSISSNDSGYERSPSNFHLPNSPQFFMDMDEDILQSSVEDDELCSDADTLCHCHALVHARGPSDRFCDMCSEQSSSHVRSSPIPIPSAHSLPSSLPACCSSPPPSSSFLSRSHPRTWPHVMMSITRVSTVDLLRGHGGQPLRSVSRLRSVDSSYSSSSVESFFETAVDDDEDLDNVFHQDAYEMAREEFPDYRRRLNSDISVHPLPDLILQSSPRRSRSASVNLPPDHAVLRDIGRSLRRISDDFQTMSGRRHQEAESQEERQQQQQRPTLFTLFRRRV